MSEAENLKIEDVCTFIGGSQPPKSVFSDVPREGYVRLVQIRDFKNENFPTYIPKDSTNKFFGKKDIMIGRYGPPIFQILRGLEGAYNVALLKAKPKSNILNDYLYYFLQQKDLFEYVDKLSPRTGGQTGVDLASLNKYPIRLPGLPIQQKISKVLSDLDAKIELNNRINAELEAMAKLVYEYWFVQFDFPNSDGKPYKSSGGKMVWNEELKRDVPEGWGSDNVGNLLQKEPKTIKVQSSDYNFAGAIPIIDQSTDFICGYTDDENSRIIANEPRIVFGDHTRILKFINFDFARGADGTQILLSNNTRVPQHYFYNALQKIDLSNYGYARHFKFLKDSRIIVPSLNTALAFEEIAKPWYDKIRHNIFENIKLSTLRDWLLPMLMNGQVAVDELSHRDKLSHHDGLGDLEEELRMVAEPKETYQTSSDKG